MLIKYSCIYWQIWNRRWRLLGLGRLHLTYCWRSYLQYRCWKGRVSIKVIFCFCIRFIFITFMIYTPAPTEKMIKNVNFAVQNSTHLLTNNLVPTHLSQQIKALCRWLAQKLVKAENPESPETAKRAASMGKETTPRGQLLMHMCDLSSCLLS